MIDRKTIIQALECCINPPHCDECPWQEREICIDPTYVPKNLLEAALELLKPVEPITERQNELDVLYKCGNCGLHFFMRHQKFCAFCGRAVKWDE